MNEHYAIRAANRMVEALDENASLAQLVKALSIGCIALKNLARDSKQGGPLWRDLERLSALKKNYQKEFSKATESIGYFSDMFRHVEEEALLKAGASKKLIRFMFADIETLLTAIRREDLSPDRAMHSIERLRHSVCSVWEAMHALLAGSNRRGRIMRKIKQSLLGVSGAGVIAANGSADAITTLGLLPWMTAVSGGFGGALLGAAIGDGGADGR